MAFLVLAILSACTCDTSTLTDLVNGADAIFIGELSNLSEDAEGCSGRGSWNYAILVHEVFKGEVKERVNVRSTAQGPNSCAIPVKKGERFLIYANKVDNVREYHSDLCMGTKAVDEATADLTLLGDSYPPGDVGCSSGTDRHVLFVILISGLLYRRHIRRRLGQGQ